MDSFSGAPWRTQGRLKQMVDSQYKPTPQGLAGNDDLGQMSAWLMFTGLGFYPVAPGRLEYVIGRPFVEHATLNLPNGKQSRIITEGLGDAHPYVGKMLLNRQPLEKGFITHAQIEAGRELRSVMSVTPNKAWATKTAGRPHSMSGFTR